MKKRIEIYSFLSGAIFLLSGFAKSIDTAQFAQTIQSYGLAELRYLAPGIIIAELFLGLALIFQYRLRQVAAISTTFLAILTGAFLYGWLVNGITDCGCFGKLTLLSSSPWVTLGKNAILFYFLIDIWLNSDTQKRISEAGALLSVVVIAVGSAISGYTHSITRSSKEFQPKPIAETPLDKFITTSPDSTYLVFAFSYTCPHCLNSIANLQQYEKAGIVDKVIGLAVENSEAEKKFQEFFNPQFTIQNTPIEEFTTLTTQFPVTYIIRHDSLINVVSGELPSAFNLTKI